MRNLTHPRKKDQRQRVEEERRQAAQALLNRTWITKGRDPELLGIIKDQYEVLRDWFHHYLGYALIVTRSFAKLEKIPGLFRPWMGVRAFLHPRDYALFAYGLWFLEGRGEADQFLLSEMVEAIREHLLGAQILVDFTLFDHRQSMVRALRKLRELDVLIAVEGEETAWAQSGGQQNVLYEGSPMARYLLRGFLRDLQSYESVDALASQESLGHTALAEDDGAQSLSTAHTRHQVYRRLLFEPIVYDWQWTEEERRYVQTQRPRIIEQMSDMFGLACFRYKEGLYTYWSELTGEMELFPTMAMRSDLILLFAALVRQTLANAPAAYEQDSDGSLLLTRGDFEALIMQMKTSSSAYWSKEYREMSTGLLADELITHLEEWNLGRRLNDYGVAIYPALANWSGQYSNEDGSEADE